MSDDKIVDDALDVLLAEEKKTKKKDLVIPAWKHGSGVVLPPLHLNLGGETTQAQVRGVDPQADHGNIKSKTVPPNLYPDRPGSAVKVKIKDSDSPSQGVMDQAVKSWPERKRYTSEEFEELLQKYPSTWWLKYKGKRVKIDQPFLHTYSEASIEAPVHWANVDPRRIWQYDPLKHGRISVEDNYPQIPNLTKDTPAGQPFLLDQGELHPDVRRVAYPDPDEPGSWIEKEYESYEEIAYKQEAGRWIFLGDRVPGPGVDQYYCNPEEEDCEEDERLNPEDDDYGGDYDDDYGVGVNSPSGAESSTKIRTGQAVIRIAAIGDSNSDRPENYLTDLEKISDGKIVAVYNQGRSCWQTEHFRTGASGFKGACDVDDPILEDAIESDPDYLIMQAGVNDLSSGKSSADVARSIIKNIEIVRNKNPEIRIILFTVPGCEGFATKKKELNEKKKAECEDLRMWVLGGSWRQTGDIAIDLNLLLSQDGFLRKNLSRDRVHWNRSADMLIATAILSKLKGNPIFERALSMTDKIPMDEIIGKLNLAAAAEVFSTISVPDIDTPYGRHVSLDPRKKKFDELDPVGKFMSSFISALITVPLLVVADSIGSVDVSKMTTNQLITLVKGDLTTKDLEQTKVSAKELKNKFLQIFQLDKSAPIYTGGSKIKSLDLSLLPHAGIRTPSRSRYTAKPINSIPPDIIEAAQYASSRYKVPMGLLLAILQLESGFSSSATSNKGAKGVGQLMPSTISGCSKIADEMGLDVETRQDREFAARNNYFNIFCGAKHLKTSKQYASRTPLLSDFTLVEYDQELDGWYRAATAYYAGDVGSTKILNGWIKKVPDAQKWKPDVGFGWLDENYDILVYANLAFTLWVQYEFAITVGV